MACIFMLTLWWLYSHSPSGLESRDFDVIRGSSINYDIYAKAWPFVILAALVAAHIWFKQFLESRNASVGQFEFLPIG